MLGAENKQKQPNKAYNILLDYFLLVANIFIR